MRLDNKIIPYKAYKKQVKEHKKLHNLIKKPPHNLLKSHLDDYYKYCIWGGRLGNYKLQYSKKIPIKYIQEIQKNEFIVYSKEKQAKKKKYLDRCYLTNRSTGEIKKIENTDIKAEYKRYYNYISNIIDYINLQALNKNLIPVFVTITLPSAFHPTTTTKKNNKIFNKKFEYHFDNYISEGYKNLQGAFRTIHKTITKNNKKNNIKTPYFRVVEPHKDYTPHMHFVMYLPQDAFDKKIKLLYDIIHKLIGKKIIGKEYKVEILEDISKGSAYLKKYLKKILLSNNELDLYFLDGWKKKNKIRLFSNSQVPLNKGDYIKILPDFIQNTEPTIRKGDEYINRYEHIANNSTYVVLKNPRKSNFIDLEKAQKVVKTIQNTMSFDYKYVIFELREKQTLENELSATFAKTTLQKSNVILNSILYSNDSNDMYEYYNNILSQTREFLADRERELELLYSTIYNNNNLIKKISKKQLQNTTKSYKNKLNQIGQFFNNIQELLVKAQKLNYKISTTNIAVDLRTKKGKMAWEIYKKEMQEYREQLKLYTYELKNKIEKGLIRILYALQEKMVCILENKYNILDKVIYKVTKNNIKIIFNKRDMELVKVNFN